MSVKGFFYNLLDGKGHSSASNRLRTLLFTGAIIGYSVYLVVSKPKKAGHDLVSQERPQSLRNEQERTFEAEKLKAEQRKAAQKAQQPEKLQ